MNVILRVHAFVDTLAGDPDWQTFTYQAEVLEGDLTVLEELRDGHLERGDVEVGLTGSFLGAESRYTLPGEPGDRWRAQLALPDAPDGTPGAVLVDGEVDRDQVSFIDRGQVWGLRLFGGADKAFWSRLDDLFLTKLDAATVENGTTIAGINAEALEETAAGRTAFVTKNVTVFTLRSVCELVLNQAADLDVAPLPSFGSVGANYAYLEEGTLVSKTFVRETDPWIMSPRILTGGVGASGSRSGGGGRRPTIEHRDYLPAWTGRKLIEAAMALGGWHLRTAFAGFPSTTIQASFFRDTWSEEAGLPEAETYPDGRTRLTSDKEYYTIDPDLKDVGLAYLNTVGEASAPRTPERYDRQIRWGDPDLPWVTYPAPPFAVYAAKHWTIEPTRTEDEVSRTPDHETMISLPFVLPRVAVNHPPLGQELQGANYHTHDPDPVNHPEYTEGIYQGRPVIEPGRDVCYIMAIETDVQATTVGADWSDTITEPRYERRVVWARSGVTTPSGGDQAKFFFHELWANYIWYNYALGTRPKIGVAFDARVHDLSFAVGPPEHGLAVDGAGWAVRLHEWNLQTTAARLELMRPEAPQADPMFPPVPGLPLGLNGEYLAGNEPDEPTDPAPPPFVIIRWTPPAASEGLVAQYRVDRYDFDQSTWTELGTTRATEWQVIETTTPDFFRYRVRSQYGSTASPWTEIDIERQ